VIRLAVFDCDGTLVDSGSAIHAALAETFALHGLPAPAIEVSRRVIGLSLVEAMSALQPRLPASDHADLAETYKRCFRQARQDGRVEEPLYDGVVELLDWLEGEGWLLAIATGKSMRGLGHCLACHGLSKRFTSLQTGDHHPSKPHPSMVLQAMKDAGADPAMTYVIGDTAFDMAMAAAAGATGIGAAWGYHETQDLIAAGAAAVADTPNDVGGLLQLQTMERRYG
jgi:phosphoglycolate phosphatase